MKKVAIGCDPNASEMKMALIEMFEKEGYEYEDLGSEDSIYANVAFKVAEAVAGGEYWRGVLICGTGIGMSIAANKVQGAYAALISDVYSAERAALSNDANIVTLGSQVTGTVLAQRLVKTWLGLSFEPGSRSEPKVKRILEYEKQSRS